MNVLRATLMSVTTGTLYLEDVRYHRVAFTSYDGFERQRRAREHVQEEFQPVVQSLTTKCLDVVVRETAASTRISTMFSYRVCLTRTDTAHETLCGVTVLIFLVPRGGQSLLS